MIKCDRFLACIFCLAILFGCKKNEENLEDQLPESTVSVDGTVLMNGVEISNEFRAFMRIEGDTLIDVGFTKYKLFEAVYGYDRELSILDQPIGDTAYLELPQAFSFDIGYAVIDFDAITCRWRNTAEGYFYAERLDSLRFAVDCEGVLVKTGCSNDQGEPDTITIKVEGILTLLK